MKEDFSMWLDTDEQHDVLVSLIEVEHQLRRVADGNIHCWKWAIIALASAVNGALTCNLSGFMQVGALCEQDAEQMIASSQMDAKAERPKDPCLAKPGMLLKRARRTDKRLEPAGPILNIDSNQARAFRRLFHLRNAFLHFKPLGWSIETSGMVSIFQEMLSIIDQTITGGWSFRHLGNHDRKQLDQVRLELLHLLGDLDRE
jgi:hypothetical protein